MIYLGSYAAGSGHGIGVAALRDGALRLQSTAECPAHPASLAVAPGALYAAHELEEGLVSAFAIGDAGDLRLLGTQPSGGAQPCHLSVHPSGRYVLSVHWGSGSVVVHRVGRGGALGPATEVVENPKAHAHMVVTDPAGGWVLAVHLGAGTVSPGSTRPLEGSYPQAVTVESSSFTT